MFSKGGTFWFTKSNVGYSENCYEWASRKPWVFSLVLLDECNCHCNLCRQTWIFEQNLTSSGNVDRRCHQIISSIYYLRRVHTSYVNLHTKILSAMAVTFHSATWKVSFFRYSTDACNSCQSPHHEIDSLHSIRNQIELRTWADTKNSFFNKMGDSMHCLVG